MAARGRQTGVSLGRYFCRGRQTFVKSKFHGLRELSRLVFRSEGDRILGSHDAPAIASTKVIRARELPAARHRETEKARLQTGIAALNDTVSEERAYWARGPLRMSPKSDRESTKVPFGGTRLRPGDDRGQQKVRRAVVRMFSCA
jgi:hypothetical protein